MPTTWPYALFVKAAKNAGGPQSFCASLVEQGFQKGTVTTSLKCIPIVLVTGVASYMFGRSRKKRQEDKLSLEQLNEELLDILTDKERERFFPEEASSDGKQDQSTTFGATNEEGNASVDYRQRLDVVKEHWYMANMNLGERMYDPADPTHRQVLESCAANNIRNGMEIAVDCILSLNNVDDIDSMSLCQKITACDRHLEPALVKRMHQTRMLCNTCVHDADHPADVREKLSYAAKTLGTVKSYLETFLNSPLH